MLQRKSRFQLTLQFIQCGALIVDFKYCLEQSVQTIYPQTHFTCLRRPVNGSMQTEHSIVSDTEEELISDKKYKDF